MALVRNTTKDRNFCLTGIEDAHVVRCLGPNHGRIFQILDPALKCVGDVVCFCAEQLTSVCIRRPSGLVHERDVGLLHKVRCGRAAASTAPTWACARSSFHCIHVGRSPAALDSSGTGLMEK